MRIISWNLNGLLSAIRNNVFEPVLELNPDLLCIQEIRTKQEPMIAEGYHHFWNHASQNGYAGTVTLCNTSPCHVNMGAGVDASDLEGRLITVETPRAYVLNVYVPNSQKNLERHAYRRIWDEQLIHYVTELRMEKPVIICGDFNTTRSELDVFPENTRSYWAEQGYMSDERSNLESLLDVGLVDAFRYLYPQKRSYTWWSNRLNKRKENRGWRLDYFLVDVDLVHQITAMEHLSHIHGSDHCPIMIEVEI